MVSEADGPCPRAGALAEPPAGSAGTAPAQHRRRSTAADNIAADSIAADSIAGDNIGGEKVAAENIAENLL